MASPSPFQSPTYGFFGDFWCRLARARSDPGRQTAIFFVSLRRYHDMRPLLTFVGVTFFFSPASVTIIKPFLRICFFSWSESFRVLIFLCPAYPFPCRFRTPLISADPSRLFGSFLPVDLYAILSLSVATRQTSCDYCYCLYALLFNSIDLSTKGL